MGDKNLQRPASISYILNSSINSQFPSTMQPRPWGDQSIGVVQSFRSPPEMNQSEANNLPPLESSNPYFQYLPPSHLPTPYGIVSCHWPNCREQFSNLSTLATHLTTMHEPSKCVCGHQSSNHDPDTLFQHLSNEHLGAAPCQWGNCAQALPDLDSLTMHIVEAHLGSNKREYVCEWKTCDRERRPFAQKQKCLRHIFKHTGHKPFACTVCGRRFAEVGVLKGHERTHTGEKPFRCKYEGCGRTFSNLGGLTVHTRVHTGERPFACTYEGCEKRFTESSNLAKHLRTHSGERPFKCSFPGCEKAFPRSDQAARHYKTHERNLARGGGSRRTSSLSTAEPISGHFDASFHQLAVQPQMHQGPRPFN